MLFPRRYLFLLFPLLLLISSVTLASSNDESITTNAASKFKAPNNETPIQLIQEWSQQDAALWKYVEGHVPAVLQHTGASAFDEHLKGVQAVLRFWNAPLHLTSAGLFHSIYGTEGFQGFSLPLNERSNIKDIIGQEAERLCWIFCMVDRYSVDQTVFQWNNTTAAPDDNTTYYTFRARPELARFDIVLRDKQEWLDFIELTLADWLEQVQGAALSDSEIFHWKVGESYAYRRLAYRKMSEILAVERPNRLGIVVPEMLKAVMATESPNTRNLHQERTPPMSQAAKDAWNALRSAGEDIPIDFSPQPIPDATAEHQECKEAS